MNIKWHCLPCASAALALVLTGCPTRQAPVLPMETPIPPSVTQTTIQPDQKTPTRRQLALWIAQGIPPDTLVSYRGRGYPTAARVVIPACDESLTIEPSNGTPVPCEVRPVELPNRELTIAADGTVTRELIYQDPADNKRSVTRIAQADIKRILDQFVAADFFSLGSDAQYERGEQLPEKTPQTGCIIDMEESRPVTIAISVFGASKSVTYNDGVRNTPQLTGDRCDLTGYRALRALETTILDVASGDEWEWTTR